MLKKLALGTALCACLAASPAFAWKTTTYKVCNQTSFLDPEHNILTGISFTNPANGAVETFPPFNLLYGQCTFVTVPETGQCPVMRNVTVYIHGWAKAAPGAPAQDFSVTADATHAPFQFNECTKTGITVTGFSTITYQ